jgi:hypothetical protein
MTEGQKINIIGKIKAIDFQIGRITMANGMWYDLSDNARKFLPKYKEGDEIDATAYGNKITFLKIAAPGAGPQPAQYNKYGPEQKQYGQGSIIGGVVPQKGPYAEDPSNRNTQWIDKNNSIMWQACMKIAVQIIPMTGDFGSDADQAKRVIVTTNALYEDSLRKMRGEIPIALGTE